MIYKIKVIQQDRDSFLTRLGVIVLVIFISVLAIPEVSWGDRFLDPAYIIIDAASGVVLDAQGAMQQRYPASLTKMMTLYLTFEALARGQLTLSQEIAISRYAQQQGGVSLRMGRGATIGVEEAITAVITRSANNVAVALSEALAPDAEGFVQRMNSKAAELGMAQTMFGNPTGLPNPDQITSPRDMAVLARSLARNFPDRFKYFTMRTLHFNGRTYPSYNRFLTKFAGSNGIKTGFTCASGYNLAASAERNGRWLIGVVMGGSTPGLRDNLMMHLLDKWFTTNSSSGVLLSELKATPEERQGTPPDIRAWVPACGGSNGGGGSLMGRSGRSGDRSSRSGASLGRGGEVFWGIEFGRTERRRSKALQQAQRMSSYLNQKVRLDGARAVAIKKSGRFSPVLIGLKKSQAIMACRRVRQALGGSCVTLTPRTIQLYR